MEAILRLESIFDDYTKRWLGPHMLNRHPNTTHHNRDVSRPYLHHQKTMSTLIVIRRRWDHSMSQYAVSHGSSNVHECWYRRCTLWLTYIPSNNVAVRVLNTFQNVSLYSELYLRQEEKTFISSTTRRYVNATFIIVEVEWGDHLGVEEHLRWAY